VCKVERDLLPLFLCFLVLSPAFADVVSAIRLWLHHVRIRKPVVPTGSRGQLHAWTDATKLARRSAWKKLRLQKLFCLFSIMLYAKTVNPRFLFFLLRIRLFPTRRARPIQHYISSGQETSSIQLCHRRVSGDTHVTIRSFPSFCSFFPFFCVAAEFNIPKSRYKY